MKKIIFLIILVLILKPLVVFSAVEEITSNGFDAYVKVYYPDVISQNEPFNLKIDFVDREIAKEFEGIRFNIGIPFEYVIGKKEYPYPIKYHIDEHRNPGYLVEYNGEKSMTLPVLLRKRKTTINIKMYNLENGSDIKYDSAILRFECLPSKESITLEGYKESGYPYDYEKESDIEKIKFAIKQVHFTHETEDYTILIEKILSFENYDYYFSNWIAADNHDTEEIYDFESYGKEGKIHSKCWIYDNSNSHLETEEYTLICKHIGLMIKEFGVVGLRAETKKYEIPDKPTIEIEKEYLRDTIKNALINFKLTPEGVIEKTEIEESTNLCGECKEGYVCGACGDCIRETESYDPKKVKVDVKLDIKNDNEKILDTIESNLPLRVIPEIEITYGDEKVDYCSLKEPGLLMKIKGKRLGNESYSGFTSGFVTDDREEVSHDCEVDFDDPKCVFIVSPSDQKKFFKEAKENIEEYQFTAKINGNEINKKAKITLIPPRKFELDLDSKGIEVHQGSTKVLKIVPSGGTTENIIIKATLMGPGNIGLSSKSINRNWIIDSIREGDELKVAYKAPSMGNFDIGKELASLSMVDLQKEAAKQIAIDAASSYAGSDAQFAEDLADAGKVTKEIGYIAKEFKAINGVRNIKGVHDSIPGLTNELGDATGVNEDKGEATWTEKAADVGIVGISAAQTAVGVLTFIPNKIPYVDKLSAGLQSAFSAATNIWKANLKYISKSEKISRAQELYYPVGILVTAQDISGWTVQELHMFKITYHEIK
ncbi:MAG: hypothetical protein ACOCP4_03535 [Candidatus Woesearchaeota archaeon]